MEISSAPDSLPRWTSREIEDRLGISALKVEKSVLGAREIAAIREAGIVRLEVYLHPLQCDYHDPTHVSEIKAECQKHGVSIVSAHGPGLPFGSEDEEERKAAVREGIMAARAAEELGAAIYAGHFDVGEQSKKSVTEILGQLHGSSLTLTCENLLPNPQISDCIAFVDKIDSDRFGITVDIGHQRDPDGINPFVKKEVARQTMTQCGKRLFHLHLHDFTDTDHKPAFDGNIEWGEVFAALKDIDYKGELMFEVSHATAEDVLRKTAAFPKTLVERYDGP